MNNTLDNIKNIHFIGIGGSGMYPIVEIMAGKGYNITGSDQKISDNTLAEEKMGIKVIYEHKKENVHNADLVVYTAAVHEDNPEIIEAKALNIKMMERSVILGIITSWYKNTICISGTHGKTSSCAMLTDLLLNTKNEPTAVIGSALKSIGGNGRLGKSENMVCESCEFHDTFLELSPDIAVILNIDADHLDYFKTMDNLINSFNIFAKKATKAVIVNGDCENAMKAINNVKADIITYGLKNTNEFYATNISLNGLKSSYDLMHNNMKIAEIQLNVAGLHNVSNSIAVAICAILSGVSIDILPKALEKYTGVARRLEFLGEKNGIAIADDFAHHPTEMTATLEVAKKLGYNKIWLVFQPYTYSRTAMLFDEFVEVLKIPDRVVMTEIVSAREENTYNIYTKDLVEKIPNSAWFNTFNEIADYILKNAETGDLVLTMGGGDIYKCAHMILDK